MIRTLVDRFHSRVLSSKWDDALLRQLSHLFKDLERILGVLHPKIEYPTASLSDRVNASANVTINSATFTDITGATLTITPDVKGKLLVTTHFDVECSVLGGAFGDIWTGALAVNGVLETPRTAWVPHVAGERFVPMQSLTVTVEPGVSYVLKLQARTTNVATTFLVRGNGNTGLTALLVPDPYQMPGQ